MMALGLTPRQPSQQLHHVGVEGSSSSAAGGGLTVNPKVGRELDTPTQHEGSKQARGRRLTLSVLLLLVVAGPPPSCRT